MMSSGTASVTAAGVIDRLRTLESPEDREGMARFGIRVDKAFGISVYALRKIAKEIGMDHRLAISLWDTGIHEARILAAMIDDPALVAGEQMDRWVAGFDSWDLCDQCCSNLFCRTPYAYEKAFQWAEDGREFVRRAGFVMMAVLSVHDKSADDEAFEPFFPVIVRHAIDDRNFVRKAVNWALRQIGKRNLRLNSRAIEVAEEVQALGGSSARWIAADALRELRSEKTRQRLADKSRRKRRPS